VVRLLRRLLLVLPLLFAVPASAAIPDSDELFFDILRDGKRIGTHRINFAREGDLVDVAIDIRIQVKLLMLTVFSYEHRNRETWRDGELVEIDTATDHDGKTFAVRGERRSRGFEVDNGAGKTVLTGPVMPTSYWRPEIVNHDRLLNTQTGELMSVQVRPGSETRIVARGGEIAARHYVISGDLDLEVWYDADDILVRLRFKADDGSTIDYALRPPAKSTVTAGSGN
jgi:hypothetical protein